MNRLRSRDWPLADAEVSELLLEPLRQLADAAKLQSTHNRGPLRERLTLFGVRDGDCVDKADVIVKKMTAGGADARPEYTTCSAFYGAVAALLAIRHAAQPWCGGPRRGRPGLNTRSGRLQLLHPSRQPPPPLGPATNLAADGRLPRRVAAIRASVKSAKKPAEIWREIDREPGWRGQLARAPARRRQAASQYALLADQAPAVPPPDHRPRRHPFDDGAQKGARMRRGGRRRSGGREVAANGRRRRRRRRPTRRRRRRTHRRCRRRRRRKTTTTRRRTRRRRRRRAAATAPSVKRRGGRRCQRALG